MTHECALEARSYECDSYGHVNNAVYLNYLEFARHQFMRQAGVRYEELRARGYGLVVTRVRIDFKAPVRYGEGLRVLTVPLSKGRAQLHLQPARLSGGGPGRGRRGHLGLHRSGRAARASAPGAGHTGAGAVKIGAHLQTFLVRSLAQSLTTELMEQLAGRILPDYDLHRQSGFPPQLPIPQRDAAQLIVRDMVRKGQLRRFVEALIEVERNGIMGRAVAMRFLPRVIDEIESLGFIYKEEYGQFVEGGKGAKTRGWGVLQEGSTYEFSFLRMDIAGNTKLVRKYPKAEVLRAYADLRGLLAGIVEARDGRIWHWEGDGGIAAFLFGAKNVQAVLSGMEMLLELFMYNLFRCTFAGDLHIRLAVHTGPCQYLANFKEIRSDTLRRLETMEGRFAATDSLILSPGVFSDMGTKLERFFRPVEASERSTLHQYSLGWE